MVNMASDAKNVTCEKANQAMDAAAEMAHRATERGKHSAFNVYDFASEKARRTTTNPVKFLTQLCCSLQLYNILLWTSCLAGDIDNKAKERVHYAYAYDMAANAKEGAKHKASEAYDFAAKKVDDGMNTASQVGREVKDKANHAYDFATDKAGQAMDKASDMVGEAKDLSLIHI